MKGVINKKILIIIIIVVLVIIVMLIPFLPSKKSQSAQQPQRNIIVNSTPASTNIQITYHNDSYTLSYPNTWSKTEKELSNDEGNVVIFQPQEANSKEYATITVEVLNTQFTSIDSLISLLKVIKYTETRGTIAGYPATKYTAVLPARNGSLHSIIYVFQPNEKIYLLKLEYIQPDTNMQFESQFYQIISSFSLQ